MAQIGKSATENVEPDNEIQPPAKLGKRLADVRRLLDRPDACMLSVNEVALEPERLERFTPTPCPTLTRRLTTEDAEAAAAAAAADVDLLLGLADDEPRAFVPPDRTPPTTGARNTGGEELAVRLAQMADQLRRNAKHFSGTVGADKRGPRAAEEMVGADLEVAKQVRVRVHDHRGKAFGTTCLTISSVIVVAIASSIMSFVIRFT
ncbi:hypothetical protein EDB85DRAFT_2155274 [Lactarius pseudohatsudake]|nr:hypothetical protein EDB85DRAFT_2155274 [Lactarius pseudohatsudake]